jgi:hypothetical protein
MSCVCSERYLLYVTLTFLASFASLRTIFVVNRTFDIVIFKERVFVFP